MNAKNNTQGGVMVRKSLYRAFPLPSRGTSPSTLNPGSLLHADYPGHRAVAPVCAGTGGFIDKAEAILGKRIENRSRGRPAQATDQPTEAGVGK